MAVKFVGAKVVSLKKCKAAMMVGLFQQTHLKVDGFVYPSCQDISRTKQEKKWYPDRLEISLTDLGNSGAFALTVPSEGLHDAG